MVRFGAKSKSNSKAITKGKRQRKKTESQPQSTDGREGGGGETTDTTTATGSKRSSTTGSLTEMDASPSRMEGRRKPRLFGFRNRPQKNEDDNDGNNTHTHQKASKHKRTLSPTKRSPENVSPSAAGQATRRPSGPFSLIRTARLFNQAKSSFDGPRNALEASTSFQMNDSQIDDDGILSESMNSSRPRSPGALKPPSVSDISSMTETSPHSLKPKVRPMKTGARPNLSVLGPKDGTQEDLSLSQKLKIGHSKNQRRIHHQDHNHSENQNNPTTKDPRPSHLMQHSLSQKLLLGKQEIEKKLEIRKAPALETIPADSLLTHHLDSSTMNDRSNSPSDHSISTFNTKISQRRRNVRSRERKATSKLRKGGQPRNHSREKSPSSIHRGTREKDSSSRESNRISPSSSERRGSSGSRYRRAKNGQSPSRESSADRNRSKRRSASPHQTRVDYTGRRHSRGKEYRRSTDRTRLKSTEEFLNASNRQSSISEDQVRPLVRKRSKSSDFLRSSNLETEHSGRSHHKSIEAMAQVRARHSHRSPQSSPSSVHSRKRIEHRALSHSSKEDRKEQTKNRGRQVETKIELLKQKKRSLSLDESLSNRKKQESSQSPKAGRGGKRNENGEDFHESLAGTDNSIPFADEKAGNRTKSDLDQLQSKRKDENQNQDALNELDASFSKKSDQRRSISPKTRAKLNSRAPKTATSRNGRQKVNVLELEKDLLRQCDDRIEMKSPFKDKKMMSTTSSTGIDDNIARQVLTSPNLTEDHYNAVNKMAKRTFQSPLDDPPGDNSPTRKKSLGNPNLHKANDLDGLESRRSRAKQLKNQLRHLETENASRRSASPSVLSSHSRGNYSRSHDSTTPSRRTTRSQHRSRNRSVSTEEIETPSRRTLRSNRHDTKSDLRDVIKVAQPPLSEELASSQGTAEA